MASDIWQTLTAISVHFCGYGIIVGLASRRSADRSEDPAPRIAMDVDSSWFKWQTGCVTTALYGWCEARRVSEVPKERHRCATSKTFVTAAP